MNDIVFMGIIKNKINVELPVFVCVCEYIRYSK